MILRLRRKRRTTAPNSRSRTNLDRRRRGAAGWLAVAVALAGSAAVSGPTRLAASDGAPVNQLRIASGAADPAPGERLRLVGRRPGGDVEPVQHLEPIGAREPDRRAAGGEPLRSALELTSPGAPSPTTRFAGTQDDPLPARPPAPPALPDPPGELLEPDLPAVPPEAIDARCEESEQKCDRMRGILGERPLHTISLDISPPRLDPDGPLPESPFRAWRDGEGRLLAADAQLVNLRDGRVVLRTRDGRTQRVTLLDLSPDDVCHVVQLWNLPYECTLEAEQYVRRQFIPITMTWAASALCHKPLYFEETQLERYGHTALVQPALSGAHFFVNIAVLPYKMGVHPPTECMYVLGYYRPGNCAPWLVPPVPLSLRGGLMQAGAVTGLSLLIP